MKLFTNTLAFSLLIFIAIPVKANTNWNVKNVHVVAVERFYLNNTSVLRIIYETNTNSQNPSFSCSPNTTPVSGHTNRYQASYWFQTNELMHQDFTAQALSAQAQGLPIDILFDPSGCNQSTAFGYDGLGRRMHGIRVNID